MKSITKLIIASIVSLILTVSVCPQKIYAHQPDQVYTYNSREEAVPSPNTHQVKKVVDGVRGGFGPLMNPQDIFVDSQDRIYILDSGNCRVIILDEEYEFVKELKEFNYQGSTTSLAKGAMGIFFSDLNQMLYIADTNNNRILVSDLNGEIGRIYEKPVAKLLDENTPYMPRKIVVDNMGIMYITSTYVNTGALMVDPDNNFLGFYGTNKIKETLAVIVEYIWRSFLTEEQKSHMVESFQPTEFNNIFWSEDRFVYAVSPMNEKLESPVVKLSVMGENIFPSETMFGDLVGSSLAEKGIKVQSSFVDITVDDAGFFTILDGVSGKLFQYDEECNMISAFGGFGYQQGLFTRPTSIETNSANELFVLDAAKNNITIMEQTYYGQLIRDAVSLFNQGLYEDALYYWNEVLKMNPNYFLAYQGLGKGYMSMEKYQEAMDYFELSGDQENYSKAKAENRGEVVQEKFALIVTLVIILIVIILFYDLLKKYITLLWQYCKKGMVKR